MVMVRIPHPLGLFSKGLDGRIDDPNAGLEGPRGVEHEWRSHAMADGGRQGLRSFLIFAMRSIRHGRSVYRWCCGKAMRMGGSVRQSKLDRELYCRLASATTGSTDAELSKFAAYRSGSCINAV